VPLNQTLQNKTAENMMTPMTSEVHFSNPNSNWDFWYGSGTIGAYLHNVKYNYQNAWHYLYAYINVPFTDIDAKSCGFYDLMQVNTAGYSASGQYAYVQFISMAVPAACVNYYSSTNIALTVWVYLYNSGYMDVQVISVLKVYGYVMNHYVYFDTEISDTSSPDTTDFAYYSSGAYVGNNDNSKFWEDACAWLENSGDNNYKRFIEIWANDGTGTHNFFKDDGGQSITKDNIYWEAYVNKCTDCRFGSSSQYTNGPWSYFMGWDIHNGAHLHIAEKITHMSVGYGFTTTSKVEVS
jgi:hypothetical protein